MDRRTPSAQLAEQPAPFVLQLSLGDENALSGPLAAKLGSIECIASSMSFGVDQREVTIDSGLWGSARLKPHQLRMSAITTGAPAQHLAREQRLAPERDEPLRIQIPGMKRPKSHSVWDHRVRCCHRERYGSVVQLFRQTALAW